MSISSIYYKYFQNIILITKQYSIWMCNNSFYHSLVIRYLGYIIMLHMTLACKCLPKFLITKASCWSNRNALVCVQSQRKKPWKGWCERVRYTGWSRGEGLKMVDTAPFSYKRIASKEWSSTHAFMFSVLICSFTFCDLGAFIILWKQFSPGSLSYLLLWNKLPQI